MTRLCRLVVLTLACPFFTLGASAGQQTTEADAREITAYRLTSAGLTKVVNVNRALVQQMSQDPKVQEVVQVAAEIASLEKKEELSEADDTRLEKLRARQEALEESADNPLGGDSKSLSEMEARIRNYPPLMQALQQEGMPPREYAKFWLSFIQAAFVQGFKKSGLLKELPPDVNPDNVTFIEEHAAEIEAMQKEFEALGRQK